MTRLYSIQEEFERKKKRKRAKKSLDFGVFLGPGIKYPLINESTTLLSSLSKTERTSFSRLGKACTKAKLAAITSEIAKGSKTNIITNSK